MKVNYLLKLIRKIKAIPYRLYNLHLFARNKVTMHCIGDSHLCVYRYILKNFLFKKTKVQFCLIGGATLSGIINPNSKTQAGSLISKYVNKAVRGDHTVLICFGEVDCGFVIWYRAEKYNEDAEVYFWKALDNYYSILVSIRSKCKNIIVSSIPLPTIKDGVDGGWVAQARSEVKASLRQRTDMTIRFNKEVKCFCAKNKMDFLDLEPHILNKDTMYIDDKYLNPNKNDHHLSDSAYASVVIKELKKKLIN